MQSHDLRRWTRWNTHTQHTCTAARTQENPLLQDQNTMTMGIWRTSNTNIQCIIFRTVVPPPNGVAPPSTLGRSERQSNPKMKRLHVHSQDQTYSPGYIARMWAHYSTMIEGPPIVHRIVHKVRKVFTNQSQPHSHTLRMLP